MVVEALDPIVRPLAGAFGLPEAWISALLVVLLGAAGAFLVHRGLRALAPLARRTRTDLDEILIERLHVPAGLTVFILALAAAGRILDPAPEDAWTWRALTLTALLAVWGVAGSRLLVLLVMRTSRRLRGEGPTRQTTFLSRLIHVAIFIAIFLTALAVWEVNITPLLAGAGLVGIALALAAQDTLANFFAGVAIYLDHPYRVGDVVIIDQGSTGEIRGVVQDVGLRSTRIRTRDDVLVTVPNSVIANGRVVNESGPVPQYRLRVPVSVAYESDLDHVERVLVQVATAHPLVLPDPEPRARVRRFGDSGIHWELLAWIVDPQDRGLAVHELSKAIHRTFREEGIRIPFPQRDVHLYDAGRPE